MRILVSFFLTNTRTQIKIQALPLVNVPKQFLVFNADLFLRLNRSVRSLSD